MTKIKNSQPKVLWNLKSKLGEGTLWVKEHNSIYFVDIKKKRIHILNVKNKKKKTIRVNKEIGFLAHIKKNIFILGLQGELRIVNLKTKKTIKSIFIERNIKLNRINDGKTDQNSRLWFGTMDDTEKEESGSFYCLKPSYELIKIDDSYTVTNGPAITHDDKKLYHVSSLQKKVFCYDKNNSTLSNKRIFFELDSNDGYPDGLTIDDDNFLWLAVWGGSKVIRISPNGEVDKILTFPTSQITSCVFGGPEMNILFVTSASVGKNTSQDVNAGNLFSVKTNKKGKITNE